MKKNVLVLFCVLCLFSIVTAHEYPRIDMCTISDLSKCVSYQEHEGAYSADVIINTDAQIREIGRYLGNEIVSKSLVCEKLDFCYAGYDCGKYYAKRFYSKKQGYDILFIGKTAGVDKIECLEKIVSGYVENAFGIKPCESDCIAKMICLWNTEHYGDVRFFKNCSCFIDNCYTVGLSSNYKEWAGKSCIIIPHGCPKRFCFDKIFKFPCSVLSFVLGNRILIIVIIICITVFLCKPKVSRIKGNLLKNVFEEKLINYCCDMYNDCSQDDEKQEECNAGDKDISKSAKKNDKDKHSKEKKTSVKETIPKDSYVEIMKAYLNAISEL